ncbi:ATPase AAA [Actinoplanes italicus]|uniref:ATPase family protein associated with various cellular activities (AAA) n=1 Tax=Actinoplanes italicus TaxID=113567 RepID=A0A2T0K355_9ACTN|nr:ATP-binding protein [Actinoplanes italicus]PRX17293.1 ATPase family protein associated with various cellular activities (AAA) [Actinoplanes italicus]GIE35150.1 ATPase AAA [Actinoplanes italicus]
MSDSTGLSAALRRLDTLLDHAVRAAPAAFGPASAVDRFRGLYIDADEAARLLTRSPGEPLFPPPAGGDRPGRGEDVLLRGLGLSGFEVDLLAIAVAPEVDLRYERIYAYLQDDVTRRRPSVDLAFNLLCGTAEERLAARARLSPDAPLLAGGLLREPPEHDRPLPARTLVASEQVVRFLLGETVPGPAEPVLADIPERVRRTLPELIAEGGPLCLYLRGPGARAAATAAAHAAGRPILLSRDLLAARLHGAVLCMPADPDTPWAALARHPGVTLLTGTAPWEPAPGGPVGVTTIDVPHPAPARRREIWTRHLLAHGLPAATDVVAELADRFRLGDPQIADAVAAGAIAARLEADPAENGPAEIMRAAARGQTGHELATLATRIRPCATWTDLVLPADESDQVRELARRVRQGRRVLTDWGFGAVGSRGNGVTALFSGPSGVGKTLAAEVVAADLGLDLFQIDLSRVVSRYVGDTEKNLDRVFAAARDSNAILFFDEADALFGKRSAVHDAHDRYANVEVAYLLQKMETYDGLAILATNLHDNIDTAFARRLSFLVRFPLPDRAGRELIWAGVFPPATPLAGDVDLPALAALFKVSGGVIRNIALTAAYAAADEDVPVGPAHLERAARREYRKLGRMFPAEPETADVR